jgi:hypothetical protein
MVDGSFDYMQLNKIRPMSWNPLGFVFRKDIPQNHRQKILATLVLKYHLGADTILLLGFKTSRQSASHCRPKCCQNTIVDESSRTRS